MKLGALKGRHFLTLKDFTQEEILGLLDLAAELKAKKKNYELADHFRGYNIALIFEKKVSKIRPGSWDACMMASNIAVMSRRSWRHWRNMPASRSGMA